MLDKRVPAFTKIIPLLAIAYIASPYDFIADRIPVLGQFDDLIVTVILLLVFIAASPNHVIADKTIGKKLRDLQKEQGFDPEQFGGPFGSPPGGFGDEQRGDNTVDAEFKYVNDDDSEDSEDEDTKN